MARKIFELHGVLSILGIEDADKKMKDLEKQAQKLSKSIKAFGDGLEKAGKTLSTTVTAPILAITTAIGAALVKTADYADELLDLTEITGMTSDTLQELEYVSLAVGVDFNKLADAAQMFTAKLPRLLKEGGTASNVLKQLGVSVYDSNGKIRSMNDIFPELIKKLQSVENVTLRNAMAQQILGKDLGALAPVLGISADEFDRLRQAAHDSGSVMSDDSLNAAGDLKAEMSLLGKQFQILYMNMAVDFIPVIRDSLFPIIKSQVVPAIQSFSKFVGNLLDKFKDLKPETQSFILKLTAALAITGPLLIGLGNMIKVVSSLKIAMIALNLVMNANPYVLLATAIVGVGIGIAAIVNNIKNAKKEVNDFSKAADEVFEKHGESHFDEAYKNDFPEMAKNIEDQGPLQDSSVQPDMNVFDEEKLDKKKKLEEEYAQKSFEINASAIDRLDREYDIALEKAAEVGAEKLNIDNWYIAASKKLRDEDKEKELKEIRSLELERLKEKHDTLTDVKDIQANELEQLRIQQQIELSEYEAGSAQYLLVVDKQKSARLKLEKKQAEQSAQIEKDQLEEKAKKWKQYFGMIQNAASNIFSLFQDSLQNKEDKLDIGYEKEKERIEGLNVTEEERQKLLQQLDATTDKKRKELKKKQALIDKASAIFNIGLSTAQGIMNAWATLPYYMAIAMSIVIGALGAAQTAIVAAKPIPAAKGATVESAPGKGAIMQVGEGYEDEIVFPLQTGVKAMVSELLREMGSRSGSTTVTNNHSTSRPIHLHIGTLVADDNGLKQLERSLSRMRVLEAQRQGAMI